MTNTIITCFKDEAQFKEVLKKLDRTDARWASGSKPSLANHWNLYKEESALCIQDNVLTCDDLTYHGKEEKEEFKDHDFITARHFLESEDYNPKKYVKVRLKGGEEVEAELI